MEPLPSGTDHQSVAPEARILLIGILVLAGALRLTGLGEAAWLDEVSSISFSTGTPGEVLARLYPQHMPVFFWITSVFLWFGDGEVWLRVPSVLFGMGVVYLLFKIGVELGSVRLGLTASALAAASGFLVHYSQEIRMYGTVVFLSMAGTWAMLRILAQTDRKPWPWIALCATSILNLYTSPFAVFMVMTHWYVLGFRAVFRSELRLPTLFLSVIVAVSYVPGILHMRPMLAGTAEVVAAETADYESVARLLGMSFVHFGGLVPILVLALGVGCIGGLVIVWRQNRLLATLVLLSVFLPIVALFLAKPGHFFKPRYLIYAQPHLLLFVATFLIWLWDKSVGRASMPSAARLGGPGILGAAGILAITALTPDADRIGRRGDWHLLADGILERLQEGDRIFVEPWHDDSALLYHLDQRSPEGRRVQLSDLASHSWYRMFRYDWLRRRRPESYQGPEVTVMGLEDRSPLAEPGRTWLITHNPPPPGFRRLRAMPPIHSYSGGVRTNMPTLFFRQ